MTRSCSHISRPTVETADVLCVAVGMIGMLVVEAVFGASATELLAEEIAARLRAVAPAGSSVERVGPGEIVVVTPSTDHDGAWVERLMQATRESVASPIGEISIGYAAGVACSDGRGRRATVERARQRLTVAAQRGAGTVEWLGGIEPPSRAVAHLDSDAETCAAMIRVQPIVSILTGEVVGYEASTRSRGAQRFIAGDVVETGDATVSDEGFVRVALDFLEHVRHSTPNNEARLSVKVASSTMATPSFVDNFLQRLASATVNPSWLQLELADRFDAAQRHTLARTMSRLQDVGVRIALDDFGCGPTDLCSLSALDFDAVNLSPRLLVADPHADHVLRSVVRLAHKAGVKVVAKGVETPEQHERLVSAGCLIAQGPLYGHAEPFQLGSRPQVPINAAWGGLAITNQRLTAVRSIASRHCLENAALQARLRALQQTTGAEAVLFALNEPGTTRRVVAPATTDQVLTDRLTQWGRSLCETYQRNPDIVSLADPTAGHATFGTQVIDTNGLVLGGLLVVAPAINDAALTVAMLDASKCMAVLLHALAADVPQMKAAS